MIQKEINDILSLSLTFLRSCSICSVIICVYINYEQSKCIRKHLNKLQILIKSKILLNSSYPAALTLNVRIILYAYVYLYIPFFVWLVQEHLQAVFQDFATPSHSGAQGLPQANA